MAVGMPKAMRLSMAPPHTQHPRGVEGGGGRGQRHGVQDPLELLAFQPRSRDGIARSARPPAQAGSTASGGLKRSAPAQPPLALRAAWSTKCSVAKAFMEACSRACSPCWAPVAGPAGRIGAGVSRHFPGRLTMAPRLPRPTGPMTRCPGSSLAASEGVKGVGAGQPTVTV